MLAHRSLVRRLSLESLEDRRVPATVTNLNDSGAGSLRAAIAATPAGGTVDFQAGLSGIINLTSTTLSVAKNNITIAGPGAGVITVSGNQTFGIFSIPSGETATISGLTITNGSAPTGGGILNHGKLSLTGVVVTGNDAGHLGAGSGTTVGLGGGIESDGTLTLRNCVVSNNTAEGQTGKPGGSGGGIDSSGTLTLIGSTVSGNSVTGGNSNGTGGGIENNGMMVAFNSTIAGNTATDGGGIGLGTASGSSMELVNCTISANTATTGAGGGLAISGSSATIQLVNTLVAGNVAVATSSGPDIETAVAIGANHCLIGDGSGGGISNGSNGNLVGTRATPINPQLGSLAANGGPTETMALLTGSPAIDAGDSVALTLVITDQRGAPFSRVSNGKVDIGAFEAQPATGSPEAPTARTVLVSTAGQARAYAPDATNTLQPTTGVSNTVEFRPTWADVNGDGLAELLTITGPGSPTRLQVEDTTGGRVAINPFGKSFTGGGFVAAADLNGDGKDEIIVAPDAGKLPRVKIYSLVNGALVLEKSFDAIPATNYTGGLRVATGDINGDGTPDLVVTSGAGRRPLIAVWNGATLLSATPTELVPDFLGFPATATGGVYVAVGDFNGDGFADIALGTGPGVIPAIKILSGQLLSTSGSAAALAAPLASFTPAGKTTPNGIRVAAKDVNGDGKADLLTGSGVNAPGRVRVYLGSALTATGVPPVFQTLGPFTGTLADGIYLG